MSVNVDPENIKADVTADSRGHVTLGSEYTGEKVTVAVLTRDE